MIKSYPILMIDPPWPKLKGGIRRVRPYQQKEFDYSTMDTHDIFKLLDREIFPACAAHCVFMWCIEQFLTDCEQHMTIRGYRRHCRFIWDKTNGIAPAFTIRFTHEYLIWFYKPKLLVIAENCRGVFKTVFSEKSREHSRKPDAAYCMIEQLYPQYEKIDVFSREKRGGWDQYGNQINYFKNERYEKDKH